MSEESLDNSNKGGGDEINNQLEASPSTTPKSAGGDSDTLQGAEGRPTSPAAALETLTSSVAPYRRSIFSIKSKQV